MKELIANIHSLIEKEEEEIEGVFVMILKKHTDNTLQKGILKMGNPIFLLSETLSNLSGDEDNSIYPLKETLH